MPGRFSFGTRGFGHRVSARRVDDAAVHLVVVPESIVLGTVAPTMRRCSSACYSPRVLTT